VCEPPALRVAHAAGQRDGVGEVHSNFAGRVSIGAEWDRHTRTALRFGAFSLKPSLKPSLCKRPDVGYLAAMSTVQEIEAAIPRLSRAEIEELRAWIDAFLEDQLELTDEVKAKLDQSRREIAAGNFTTRQPK